MLRDLIENEGKKELQNVFTENIDAVTKILIDKGDEIDKLKSRLKVFEDKDVNRH